MTVSYAAPTGDADSRLQDLAGNAAETFSGHEATNNTAEHSTNQAEPANNPATGTPTLRGSAQEGQTLTVDTSAIADDDGLTNPSYSYQWIANYGTPDSDIQDATSSAYTLGSGDVGKTIKVKVSFTDDEGNEETLTSAATAVVSENPGNPATGAPEINGTAQVGRTLTVSTTGIADDDGLTGVSYAYQWIRYDHTNHTSTEIDGAASSTYTAQAADVGRAIMVKVSFTDDEQNQETLTSEATPTVTATVPEVPSQLTVSLNDTGKLDLSWDAPNSNGGAAITSYKVQWKDSTGSWDTPADVSEATVTGTTHTASGLTDGTEYAFRVLAVNSAGDSDASGEAAGTPRETTAPTVSTATVDGSTLTITFSEDLTESPVPPTAAFSVTVGGATAGVNSVAISGSTVTLALASAVASGEQVTVDYTVPTDQADARLKDLNENAAGSFSGQQATNNTAAPLTPLTASSHDVPAAHDGQNAIIFELRFSENLEGFSYKTLRDHAFTVTGGQVTKARRLDRPQNIRWEITVQPDGDGTVTIVLPITIDCSAEGAVCTGDGRMLSNQVDLTVSGPNG